MAAYKAIHHYSENGASVTDMLVISDTYAGLFDIGAATEVNALYIAETSQELKDGASITSGAKFTANEAFIASVADTDCIALLNSVLDGVNVYVARLINPSTPAVSANFCFLGKVESKVSAKDFVHGNTTQFSTTTDAKKTYSYSATSFDSGTFFGKKIGELVYDEEGVFQIDSTWISAHVQDRLAYFRTSDDDFGIREVRFAQLVPLQTLIEKLLSLAAEAGISFTYTSTNTNLHAIPCYYLPVKKIRWSNAEGTYKVFPLRYCSDGAALPEAPMPYTLNYTQGTRLKTGGDAIGSPYVSFSVVRPSEKDKLLSWLDLSLYELLSRLALCFGSVLKIDYVDTDTIGVQWETTETFTAQTFLMRDFISSEQDISLTLAEGTSDNEKLHGVSMMLAKEGAQFYHVESEPKQIYTAFMPVLEPPFLPITLSPTWGFFTEKGEDAGINLVDKVGRALLPHNAVFYDEGAIKSAAFEYNLAGIHTALYTQTLGVNDSFGEVGVEGYPTWRTVGQILALLNGSYKYFNEMETFVRERNIFSASYREHVRKITVPGLLGFKATFAGSEDWRNVKVGFVATLDGVDYVATKVTRKLTTTELELHKKEEFSLTYTNTTQDNQPNTFPQGLPNDDAKKGVVVALPTTSVNLAALSVVGIGIDGRIFELTPFASDYGTQMGVLLEGFNWETDNPAKMLRVQTRGEVYLGDDATVNFPFTPNAPLYLRNDSPNFSDVAITPPTSESEPAWHLQIGRMSADGLSLSLDFGDGGFLYE